MDMKVFGIEVSRIKNQVIPPPEQKYGDFTIITTPVAIIPADITQFKTAWLSARSQYIQSRQTIYDIYQNALDFDAHLRAVIEKRLLATVGKKLQYTINDEQPEAATRVMQSPKFTEFLTDLVMVRFWGMGLFQFKTRKWNDQLLFDYYKVPIKHIDPYQKKVMKLQYSPSVDDKSYDKLKDVIFVGEADCGGLLQQAALLAMYKREMINGWTQYGQLAATNFKQVKYKAGQMPDPKRREEIRQTIGTFGRGVVDYDQGLFDLQESNQTSSSQNELFEGFVAYLDDQITTLVLGQTMTTEDGSSKSQAEVHERTQETIFDADSKMVLDILNYDFYEVQQMYGIPAGGLWSFVESATTKNINEIEKDLKLKELGFVFSQQQIAQKYGLELDTPTV